MNKKIFSLLALIGILMAGCVNENNPSDQTIDKLGENTVKGYLSVKLVTPGGIGSRDGTYVNGDPEENYVNLVRFYFFNSGGQPVYVSKNPHTESDYYSFYDWDPTKEDNENAGNDASETVEKILNTTIVLSGPKDYKETPTLLVAVLNPTSELLARNNLTLDELRKEIKDYKTGLMSSNFVITNSVYVNREGNVLDYTPIDIEKNLAFDIETAKENALVVYVERVLARLDLTIGGEGVIAVAGKDNVYDTGKTFKPVDNSTMSTEVYVKLLGWNITQTPTTSRLIKQINALWPEDMFGDIEPWNSDNFYRSFWAINPPELEYEWCSFNEVAGGKDAQGQDVEVKGLPMSSSRMYMQENANPYEMAEGIHANPERPTQVIVVGQLVDANENPIEIAEYRQEKYTKEGLLNYVANHLGLYTKKTDGTGYDQIQPDQLTFMTAAQWNPTTAGPDGVDGYYVYFVLTDEAQKLTWYRSPSGGNSNEDDFVEIENDKINQFIYDSVYRAMVWKSGMTYYFFNIEHLGAEGHTGYWGVVRNHIYDARVGLLSGLGTPVYDPNEVIYPEEVDNSGNLLAAQIRILQWRLVTGNYTFSW